jgi:hypothetical protein
LISETKQKKKNHENPPLGQKVQGQNVSQGNQRNLDVTV